MFEWFRRFIKWFRDVFRISNSVITDEMRDKSLEVRRLNHQVSSLRKELELKAELKQLQEEQEELNNPKISPEEQFIQMLSTAMLQGKTQENKEINGIPFIINDIENKEIHLNTSNPIIQQIKQYKGMIPIQYKDLLKELSDEELLALRKEVIK